MTNDLIIPEDRAIAGMTRGGTSSLLASGERLAGDFSVVGWQPPPGITADERSAIAADIRAIEMRRRTLADTPNGAEWLTARIVTLMEHYYVSGSPNAVKQGQLKDYSDDLIGFTKQAVEAACTEYRRTEPRKRPSPGSLRDLAKRYDPEAEKLHRLKQCLKAPLIEKSQPPEQQNRKPTEDEIRRVGELVEQCRRRLRTGGAE